MRYRRNPYAALVPVPSLSRFLRYRFAAYVGWVVLVVGTTLGAIAVTDGIESDPLRLVLRWAALVATVLAGMRVQRWMLHDADADGRLRAQLREMNGSLDSRR